MPASALALVADKQKPQAVAAPVAAEVVVLKFGSSVLRNAAEAPAVASEIYGHVRAGRKASWRIRKPPRSRSAPPSGRNPVLPARS